MANLAHGFAALGFYSRRLMQLLLCRCHLATLKPQELSNVTWAVAKLGHDVHEGWVFEVLDVSQGFMQQGRLKPQEMCNIAWGVAVMQRRCLLAASPPLRHTCTRVDDAWKASFCQSVTCHLTGFNAADLAMCLWALAVLGYSRVQQAWLDQLVAQAALHRLNTFSCSDIGLLFWGMARLRHWCNYEHWVSPMVVHFLAGLDDCVVAAPAISNVVHALPLLPGNTKSRRRMKQQLGLMLPQLAAASQDRLAECGPRELVQLLQGFARLGFRPSDGWVLSHRARVLELGLDQFSSRERATLAVAEARLKRLTCPDPCYSCMAQPQAQPAEQEQKEHDDNKLMLVL
eukprot:gene1829-2163_t